MLLFKKKTKNHQRILQPSHLYFYPLLLTPTEITLFKDEEHQSTNVSLVCLFFSGDRQI